MKFRHEKIEITRAEELELEAWIRETAIDTGGEGSPAPPDAYWQNSLVRANEKIDRATSGKALSINWAFRVAIPGVVAIISFVIGLHYYVPERTRNEETVSAVILSLPTPALDSLLTGGQLPIDASLSVVDVGGDPFTFSQGQIADYLIVRGEAETLVESMTDQQVGDMIVALGSRTD